MLEPAALDYHLSSAQEPLILEATFEEILPFWRDHLWSGRDSAIEAVSIIDHLGDKTLRLTDLNTFGFLKVEHDQSILGVVSYLKTSIDFVRLRGLWVAPEARGNGLGRALVFRLIEKAKDLKGRTLWIMARATGSKFYDQFGFKHVRTVTDYEFGPHHIMHLRL